MKLISAFTCPSTLLALSVSPSDQSKAMLTELCLASDEFDHFSAQTHNSVTFCLKELRVRQRIELGLSAEHWED